MQLVTIMRNSRVQFKRRKGKDAQNNVMSVFTTQT